MERQRKKFAKIYDQYIEKIYRFVFLKVNNKETAQDLTAETFVRVWEKFRENEKIKNAGAFLYQVAKNLITDYYRQRGRTEIISTQSQIISDINQNLEEKIILKSQIESIKKVLFELKEEYQDVIIWYYLDDLSVKEISKMLNRTEGATRVLIHRALESLKEKTEKSEII